MVRRCCCGRIWDSVLVRLFVDRGWDHIALCVWGMALVLGWCGATSFSTAACNAVLCASATPPLPAGVGEPTDLARFRIAVGDVANEADKAGPRGLRGVLALGDHVRNVIGDAIRRALESGRWSGQELADGGLVRRRCRSGHHPWQLSQSRACACTARSILAGSAGFGTRPRCWFACVWRRQLASGHCTSRPSVGPNVFWLCQRSPWMTCPV